MSLYVPRAPRSTHHPHTSDVSLTSPTSLTRRLSVLVAACALALTSFIAAPGVAHAALPAGKNVVISEVVSKGGDPDDWIELANTSDTPFDLSGYVLKDDDDKHSFVIPNGTVLPAGGYIVFDTKVEGVTPDGFDFGLGGKDEVRLFDHAGNLIDKVSWESHATAADGAASSYIRNDDGSLIVAPAVTKGTANVYPGETPAPDQPAEPATPEGTVAWDGPQDVTVIDKDQLFLEDSSGLDYANGYLWAVDNGTGTFWKLKANQDGFVSYAPGFEKGKRAVFPKDADNLKAKGPDAEGITIAGDGNVYLGSERDNSDKKKNFNSILQVDPNKEGTRVVASKMWDLTAQLPPVDPNLGIEGVEWVPMSAVDGKLWDNDTNAPFRAADYPDAVAKGVFFVAYEANGHVYAFVLNDDETATRIADIDSGIGGVMDLNYDPLTDRLIAESDDGYAGVLGWITLNGTDAPAISYMARPTGMPNVNNEGFALSTECVNGTRPAWWFQDGVKTGALTSAQLNCDEKTKPLPVTPGTGDSDSSSGDSGKANSSADALETDSSGQSSVDGDAEAGQDDPSGDSAMLSDLATTGAAVAGIAVIAVLLIASGVVLVWLRRKDAEGEAK